MRNARLLLRWDDMKVVLVNPPCDSNRKIIRNIDCSFESKGNYLYQPMDFIQLTGVFSSEKWDVSIIDAVADKLSEKDVLKSLRNIAPEIIITAVGDVSWNSDKKFLEKIKNQFACKYYLSLGNCYVEDSAIIEVKNFIDGVIVSPWDMCADEFLGDKNNELSGVVNSNNIKRIQNKKIPRQCKIETPKHELFIKKNYRWPFARFFKYTTVFTAWGCPNSCDYCTGRKSPFLFREYIDVLVELDQIFKQGIREIYFADRSFGLPIDNVKKLLREMIKRNYKFSWSSYFHTNQYDSELLELMKKSGCHTLIIGVENHDVQILKKYNRNINIERLNTFMSHTRKLNIDVCADFLLGLEGQSKEDILKSVNWAINQNVSYASFNILAPNSGTSIREMAINEGIISINDRQFDSLGTEGVLGSKVLAPEQLINLRNKCVKKFYMRPNYLMKRLLSITSFTHFWIQFQEMLWIFFKAR